MRTIKIVPGSRLGGEWCAKEGPGVVLRFCGRNGKQCAIECALAQLGEGSGKIHVYDRAGRIIEKIAIKGGIAFGA